MTRNGPFHSCRMAVSSMLLTIVILDLFMDSVDIPALAYLIIVIVWLLFSEWEW